MMADRFEHAPNLAIAPFDERDLVPGIRSLFDSAHLRRASLHALSVIRRDGNSGSQLGNSIVIRRPGHLDHVGFGNM